MSDPMDALLQQGAALHQQGRRAEAIEIFRQVLSSRPESSEGWYELGYLLKAEGRYEDAMDAYANALERGVKRPEEVHLNCAVIYSDHLRRDDDAERELGEALRIRPDYTPALLNLGNLHEERGDSEAALSCYDKILSGIDRQEHPFHDLCYEALARVAKLRQPADIEDPMLARMQQAAKSQAGKTAKANLLFALGHAYDKLGEFDRAFDAFAKANRWLLRQSGRTYDRARTCNLTNALIASFRVGEEQLSDSPVNEFAQPLFICGMFRSGSTLVEQVLGAHSEVTPGGELDFLRRLAVERLAPFPSSVATPDPVRDARLAAEYIDYLAGLFPDARNGSYVTDKRPDNFVLIGLIKRLFPQAKIVHTIRNPLDNGLSLFMQHLNPQVAGYSTDLGDIGHYYVQYRRLMAHWKELYPDTIHDFCYEDFIGNPRATLAALLEFMGLPWDDRCLDFHRLGNTVKTASYWQVRQPLNASAHGRWRHYLSHLAPLQEALREIPSAG